MNGAAGKLDDERAPAVEIITIGDELLLGETVDHNSAWLGQVLARVGIRVARRAAVGDDAAAIKDAVAAALERTGVALCTGGLGPTPDDLTKPAVAELFGRDLVLDEALLRELERRFAERGVQMAAINRTQAEIPRGAMVLPNPRGTAPGLAFEDAAGRLAILLPGVPYEMRAIVQEHVIPLLLSRWPERGRPIVHRRVRTTGIPESTLAERVDDLLPTFAPLTVAFLPSATGVDLRLTSWGVLDAAEAERALDAAEAALRERVGRYIYGRDDEDLVDAVARELTARSLTLALAESCTGGLIAKRLTDRPGASDYLLACIVAYANEAKVKFLGVDPATLAAHGAVSEEVAREMVEGALRTAGADAALAVTGVAGPGGGTPAKPVGTVWIAAALGERRRVRRFRFGGDREEIRDRSAQAALAMLYAMLRGEDEG